MSAEACERMPVDIGCAANHVVRVSHMVVEIVPEGLDQIGPVVQHYSWIVERFFGWIKKDHSVSQDVEARVIRTGALFYNATA